MEKKALPMMSFVESVTTCFKKYVTFKGRARRSEYWWFAILNYIPLNGSTSALPPSIRPNCFLPR